MVEVLEMAVSKYMHYSTLRHTYDVSHRNLGQGFNWRGEESAQYILCDPDSIATSIRSVRMKSSVVQVAFVNESPKETTYPHIVHP